MKKLIIEIPDYLHRALKNKAFADDKTIKDFVSEILFEILKVKKK